MSFTEQVVPLNDVLAERYRVKKVLGAGAMGEVYLVEHINTKHLRAMKRLHPEISRYPEVVARFKNEASAAGCIGNLHIVETVDAGELSDKSPYLVMEYLEGQSLEELLKTHAPLDVATAIEIAAQAAAGLFAAHSKNIVHRDIKPANIFLCGSAPPFVKILDFGVSQFSQSGYAELRMTRPGELIGTPLYFSPEQARGEAAIDHRIDIYALGVVLYECLTGRTPHDAQSLPELFEMIKQGACVPLRSLCPTLPTCLVTVVERAMALQREARFASAELFELALRALPISGVHPNDPFVVTRPSRSVLSSQPTPPSAVQATTLASRAPGRQKSVSVLGQSTHSPTSHRVRQEGLSAPRGGRSIGWLVAGGLAISAGVLAATLRASHNDNPSSIPLANATPSGSTMAPPMAQLPVVPVIPSSLVTTAPLSTVAPTRTAVARKSSGAPVPAAVATVIPLAEIAPVVSGVLNTTLPPAPVAPPATEVKKGRAEAAGLNPNNPFAVP